MIGHVCPWLQVVDALMNTICRMVFQDGTPPSVLAGSLLAFVKMLSQYPAIYPDLVVRMCKLITEQVIPYVMQIKGRAGNSSVVMLIGLQA